MRQGLFLDGENAAILGRIRRELVSSSRSLRLASRTQRLESLKFVFLTGCARPNGSSMRKAPLMRDAFQVLAVGLLCISLAYAQDAVKTITAALRAQQYQEALQLTHAALERSPSDPQLWTLQGVACSSLGKKQEALASFRSALKLAPDYLPALQQEAQVYYEATDLAGVPVLEHIVRSRKKA